MTWGKGLIARSPRGSKIDAFADLVGVKTDPEIAALAGVSKQAVAEYRKRRGIEDAKSATYAAVTSHVVAVAGPEIGLVCDTVLAEKHGVHVNRVRRVRSSMGLISATGEGSRGGVSSDALNGHLDEVRARLGTVSDSVIAAECGVTTGNVASVRWRLNIPAFHRDARMFGSGRPRDENSVTTLVEAYVVANGPVSPSQVQAGISRPEKAVNAAIARLANTARIRRVGYALYSGPEKLSARAYSP